MTPRVTSVEISYRVELPDLDGLPMNVSLDLLNSVQVITERVFSHPQARESDSLKYFSEGPANGGGWLIWTTGSVKKVLLLEQVLCLFG